MKITLKRTELIRSLDVIKKFVDGRSAAVYRALWLSCWGGDSLLLELTDGNGTYISVNVPAEVGGDTGCEICFAGVDFQPFYKMLRYAPEALTLEMEPDLPRVRVVFATGSLSCSALEPAWKDKTPVFGSGRTVDFKELGAAFDDVFRSASADDTMDALACVRLRPQGDGTVVAEALNGHQYQRAVVPNAQDLAKFLPKDGILLHRRDVAKIIPLALSGFFGDQPTVKLSAEEKRLTFSGTRGAVSMPLGRYSYPDTDKFVVSARSGRHTLEAGAGDMRSAVRLLTELTTDTNRAIYINMNGGNVRLNVGGTGFEGEYALEADYSGSLPRIAFPAKNLLALVKRYGTDEPVRFRMVSADGPCLITGDKHVGMETILMPMKIVEDYYPVAEEARP